MSWWKDTHRRIPAHMLMHTHMHIHTIWREREARTYTHTHTYTHTAHRHSIQTYKPTHTENKTDRKPDRHNKLTWQILTNWTTYIENVRGMHRVLIILSHIHIMIISSYLIWPGTSVAFGYCDGIKMVIKGNYIPLQQHLLSMYCPDA